jgi:hypothetical protein
MNATHNFIKCRFFPHSRHFDDDNVIYADCGPLFLNFFHELCIE